jgi:hypothetical protein
MLKPFILITFVLIGSGLAYGQDTLFHLNGLKIEAKVLEVSKSEVKFLKWSNKDGPKYILNKNQLLKIIYQNGETEILNVSKNENEVKSFGNNILGINPIFILDGTALISYERFYKGQNRSIRIPLSLGFLIEEFYLGLEFKYFVTQKPATRYFLGPSFYLGTDIGYLNAFALFNNGWSFQPSKNFNFTLDFGLGPAIMSDELSLHYQVGVSIGIRY